MSIADNVEDRRRDYFCLIAGTRTYDNYSEFCTVMDYLLQNKTQYCIWIVSGGAKGADALAKRYAHEKGYNYKEFRADWDMYGKSAGFKRNEQMHKFIYHYTKQETQYRSCVCFWDGQSRGTQHNFNLCKQKDTPLRVWNYIEGHYMNQLPR